MKKKRNTKYKIENSFFSLCKKTEQEKIISAIVFYGGKNKENLRNKLREHECEITHEIDLIDAYCVNMKNSELESLAGEDIVMYITADNDIKTCLDLATKTIHAPTKYTGKNIGVAVIDTGVYPHSDLTYEGNKIVKFVDFVSDKNSPYDDNGHGTHVAGIISSSGHSSKGQYRGVAPDANIIALKVISGNGEGTTSNILEAFEWINKNKEKYNIRIASISLGGSASTTARYDPLVRASEKLWDNGVVVVAAAGNSGSNQRTINTPAISKKIITVGASDDRSTVSRNDDKVAPFSSRGPTMQNIRKPDLVAPGVDIISLGTSPNSYVKMSGTSMSTPIISGCCAMLLEKYPHLTPNEVKMRLMKSSTTLNESKYAEGKGLIDLDLLLG